MTSNPHTALEDPKEFSSRSTLFFLLGIAILGVVAFIDWATWPEIQLRLCYLIPTLIVAWYVGAWAALPIAVIGSGVWLLIELQYNRPYEHPVIPYINSTVLLAASIVFTLLVSAEALRKRQLAAEVRARKRAEAELLSINETLENRVQERTAAAESRAQELQRSEEALSRSTAVLTAILATMSEGVVVTDRSGRLLLVNPAAVSLLEIELPADVQMLLPSGVDLRLFPLMDGYRGAGSVIKQALAGGAIQAVELGRKKQASDTGPWLMVSTHRVQLGSGTDDGIAFVFTDVSASKETERAVSEAIEEEQQRIGQDLHDGLGQHLVCTAMAVSVLKDRFTENPEARPDLLNGIATMLDEAITHVRDIARGLFPASLEHQGLAATLKALVDQVTRSTQIQCEIEAPAILVEPKINVSFHLYRIAQEAVANAIRHNTPTRIIVRLEEHGSQLRLSVISVGKPVETVPSAPSGRSGLGLAIMQHRARLIQGDLQHYTESQGDTVVECTVSQNPLET